MKFVVWWLVLILPMLGSALVAGCGTENVPACADVSWVDRDKAAELTGPPTFSASQIAPGDPLTLVVPVNENTLAVRVSIRSADEASGAALSKETDGDEIVELALEDTNLAAGVYRASFIDLSGDILPRDSVYRSPDADMPYTLWVSFAAESAANCLTDIPVATFTVVSEGSSGP